MKKKLLDRFNSRVYKNGLSGCWEWMGEIQRHGYGRLAITPSSKLDGQRSQLAHRVSYEIFKGPIENGMEIDHLCRNRSCVNPDHLEIVSRKENNKRAVTGYCKRGHELTEGNYRVGSTGSKNCIKCIKIRNSQYREDKKNLSICISCESIKESISNFKNIFEQSTGSYGLVRIFCNICGKRHTLKIRENYQLTVKTN